LSATRLALQICPPAVGVACEPASCRWRCAIEVIDELLAEPGAVSGEEMDRLLDLRWQLRHRENAENALRVFCELRLRMEPRHYLAFFRIRRWIENHVVAAVRPCPAAEAQTVPVKLDHYCVEAVRRACLCAALGPGTVMLVPRLVFAFRTGKEEAARAEAQDAALA
jgi:hypothetical protein